MDSKQSRHNHLKYGLFSVLLLTLSSVAHADHYLSIAYSSPPTSIPFWQQIKQYLYQETEKEHIFLIDYSGDDFSTQQQATPLQHSLKQPIDGYLIAATSSQISKEIDNIALTNRPVVAIDVAIKHPWVKPQILTDNIAASKMAAQHLHKVLVQQGQAPANILLITGDKQHQNAHERARGFIDELKPFGYRITTFYTKEWQDNIALTIALEQLKAHHYQAAYTTFSGATHAVHQAQKHYHQTDLVHIGFDPTPTIDKMMLDNELEAVIQQDGKTMIQLALRYLKARIAGEEVPDRITVPALLITQKTNEGF